MLGGGNNSAVFNQGAISRNEYSHPGFFRGSQQFTVLEMAPSHERCRDDLMLAELTEAGS